SHGHDEPGGVAERLKAAVLKTAALKGAGGSNPSSSATENRIESTRETTSEGGGHDVPLCSLFPFARETRGRGEPPSAPPKEGGRERPPGNGEMTERPKVLAC